jgi:CheY-like chemotaxis protein/signal transduction histidine kinase
VNCTVMNLVLLLSVAIVGVRCVGAFGWLGGNANPINAWTRSSELASTNRRHLGPSGTLQPSNGLIACSYQHSQSKGEKFCLWASDGNNDRKIDGRVDDVGSDIYREERDSLSASGSVEKFSNSHGWFNFSVDAAEGSQWISDVLAHLPIDFIDRYGPGNIPDKLYVRRSYKELYDEATRLLAQDPQPPSAVQLITGVPGIGKSVCIIYFIYRYLRDSRFANKRLAVEFSRDEYCYFLPSAEGASTDMYKITTKDLLPFRDIVIISHDLLSPIQALDMGFESLGNIFEDNSASLDQLSKAAMESLCLAAAVAHKGRTLETPTVSNEVKPKFGASSFKQSSIINSSSIEIESGSAVGTVLPPIVVSGSNPSPKRRTFKDKVADADAAEKAVDDTISGMRTNIESSLSSSGSHLMECKELLQTMRGSLTYMSMIINRCLDVSKVHGGLTLVPNAEFFNYMDSINKSVRYMMDMQNDICITVGECTDRISPQIYSDKKWFEGNMFCILSNAIKYSSTNATAHLVPGHEATPAANPVSSGARNGAPMVSSGKSVSEMTNPTGIYLVAESDSLLEPEGPVRPVTTVVINICYVEPESSSDSPQMKIEVHDSGPSVPANVVADFFLAPEQAARKQTGGSGMGLYTLRKRVEALGGRCGAQIREGYVDSTGNPTGTTVWFSVPYKRKSKRRYIPHPETAKAHRNRMSGAGSMPDLTAGDGKLVVSGTIVSGNGGSSKSSVDELLVTIDDPKKQQASPQHSWRSMIQQTKKVVFRGTGDKDHAESSASDEDTFDSRPLSKKSGKSHPTNKASVSFARKVLPTLETNISIDLWDSSACATIDNADDDNNGSDFNGRNPRDGSLHRPVPQAQEVMAEETDVPCGIASLNSSTLGAHDRSRAKHQDAPTQAAPSVPIAASGKMLVPGRSPQAGDGSGKSFQSQQSSQKYVTIKEPAAGQAAAVGVDTVAETASVATSSMKTPPLLFPTSPKIVIKKSLSVLVVDDSMSIMKIMKMSLERGGHGVQSAVNGKIALDFLLENHYDVVLLDLQMPVMGGIECCQRFREFEFKELQNAGATVTVTHSGVAARIKRTKRQLIIGMSANGEAMTRQDALDADMDEFIAKPFPMQSMMAALKYLDPDTMA